MRLLHFLDNGELAFEEFIGHEVPLHAILSHTWGPTNTEVTYQDLQDGSGKIKPGYRQILFCGREAVRREIQYFWVHTCCIDKSSSAELSEAINSMYRWYKDATICFAYLDDVPTEVDGERIDMSHPRACKARWFTRGWTF